MSSTLALLEALNPENILTWLGPLALIGVAFIIFAECGLLIGCLRREYSRQAERSARSSALISISSW